MVLDAFTHFPEISYRPVGHEVQVVALREQVVQFVEQFLHLLSTSINNLVELQVLIHVPLTKVV